MTSAEILSAVVLAVSVALALYARSRSEVDLTGDQGQGEEPAPPEPEAAAPGAAPAEYEDWTEEEGEVSGEPFLAQYDPEEKEMTVWMELDRPYEKGPYYDFSEDEPPGDSPFSGEIRELRKLGCTSLHIGGDLYNEAAADFPAPSGRPDMALAAKAAAQLLMIRRRIEREPRDPRP